MDDHTNSLSTTHLLASTSMPAVESIVKNFGTYDALEANLQTFPPNHATGTGPEHPTSSGGGGPPAANDWLGVFNIASYIQYFNVDTDIVLNRLLSSLDPTSGDFFNKIDANPDLYGAIWVSTTLVLVIASLGNLATYLIGSSSWSFDVSYVNLAASSVYGYAFVVPLAFYLLLQYLGSNASIVHLWCMWGYSLFVFVLSSILLVIPVGVLRWIITLVAGGISAGFVSLNLSSYAKGNDLMLVWVASLFLQFGFALFIKICFFP